MDSKLNKKASPMLLLFFGSLSGFITGFLGAGGGLVTILLLKYYAKKSFCTMNDKDILFNSLAVSIPTALVSLVNLLIKSEPSLLDGSNLAILLPSAAIGGVVGAFLLNKLNTSIIRLVFSIIVIFSGCWLILK